MHHTAVSSSCHISTSFNSYTWRAANIPTSCKFHGAHRDNIVRVSFLTIPMVIRFNDHLYSARKLQAGLRRAGDGHARLLLPADAHSHSTVVWRVVLDRNAARHTHLRRCWRVTHFGRRASRDDSAAYCIFSWTKVVAEFLSPRLRRRAWIVLANTATAIA